MAETETTEVLGSNQSTRAVSFAHESEREFAAILDYYQIRWEYEPRTFPLRWDAAGNPIESFTPDFYLVDQGLFVELTTLKQKLVTKKNRKLRLLRALYPDVRIKLFYSRDLKNLMVKYGLHRGSGVGRRTPDEGRGAMERSEHATAAALTSRADARSPRGRVRQEKEGAAAGSRDPVSGGTRGKG